MAKYIPSMDTRPVPGMKTWEPASYALENRYQDGDWTHMNGELFATAIEAVLRAQELSKDAICVGMVRVVSPSAVYWEYGAGEGNFLPADAGTPARFILHQREARQIDLHNGIES